MPAEMAQQEEGWPLGLQPLNTRIGFTSLARNLSGSVLSNTSITCSPAFSTDYSSDLDSESTESFYPQKKTTLGSLIGQLSRRSIRERNHKKSGKTKTWCFSLCSRDGIDVKTSENAASLGHFLAKERKATDNHARHGRGCSMCGPDDYVFPDEAVVQRNSLFVNGCIAPHPTSQCYDSDSNRIRDAALK